MTCRCRTPDEHAQRAVDNATAAARRERQAAETRIRELQGRTPNPDEFSVEEVEQVGPHLVLKARYPGCVRCDFDRCKVMVYLDVDLKAVIRWRRIDPHFRLPPGIFERGGATLAREAPSPAARFPASVEGWADALEYARRKVGAR